MLQPTLPTFALCLALVASNAVAQTPAELESQFRTTCSAESLRRVPDLRAQCDMIRATLDGMSASTPAPSSKGSTPLPRAVGDRLDARTQCGCERKLGRCTAGARVVGQQIVPVGMGGLSSKVIVRVEPPPGQCVEVTAFLQESATFPTGLKRTGHPLYAVVAGPTDIEWQNLSTPASRLSYEVMGTDTECYVCDSNRGGASGTASAVDAAAARAEVRAALEKVYRDCLAGTGDPLYRGIDAATRRGLCADIRKQIDQEPR